GEGARKHLTHLSFALLHFRIESAYHYRFVISVLLSVRILFFKQRFYAAIKTSSKKNVQTTKSTELREKLKAG
ncbi:MAG: hypothetical protein O3C20_18030, partial [Verrucomicrobia bacterium]|nr:hypothetical protein [Verrucomicrobiota bacterium]